MIYLRIFVLTSILLVNYCGWTTHHYKKPNGFNIELSCDGPNRWQKQQTHILENIDFQKTTNVIEIKVKTNWLKRRTWIVWVIVLPIPFFGYSEVMPWKAKFLLKNKSSYPIVIPICKIQYQNDSGLQLTKPETIKNCNSEDIRILPNSEKSFSVDFLNHDYSDLQKMIIHVQNSVSNEDETQEIEFYNDWKFCFSDVN